MPIAQINVARFRLPKDHPANAEFMAALDQVNAMAEASDGFIWRLVGEGNNATDLAAIPDDPDFIINMSVWRDVAALEAFAYRQADHRAVLARRSEWFGRMEPSMALWPVADGHVPSVEEGMAMLQRLGREGPQEAVFTFQWHRANVVTRA
jgi:heme-degrading monooxygenase HmoA